MAAAIGSHGVAAYGGDRLPKPSVIVMAYTAHSDHQSVQAVIRFKPSAKSWKISQKESKAANATRIPE
jgi:hypothetical protein